MNGEELARLHDRLLFDCAYPASPRVRTRAESQLKGFVRRVRALERDGDISPLLDPEVSGIAGTWVDTIFSFDFVQWLAGRFPGRLEIDWDDHANPESRTTVFTSLVPFLREEASVDANVPFDEWFGAARRGLDWLLRNTAAPAYDGLQLWIRWDLGNSPMTRTRMRRRPRDYFYDRKLLSRSDVSIERELAGDALPVRRLSRSEGQRVLDMARAAIATRYRELYSFTFGDPSTIVAADCGRGLEILLIGIVPEKRLPLRAGFGTFFFRNGIPTGYADAFGLGERMEISFNIFYAFRSGESAYCFARMLKLYNQLFGSTSFFLDPYQIGRDNEEAIKAGAFWFYRKLGFRATDAGVERIARREEERMASDPKHRTPASTLRRIARSALIYDKSSKWDRFSIRNLGLAIQKRFARSDGDFRRGCRKRVAAQLRMRQDAVGDLALVLDLLPLEEWSAEERADLREIVRAKGGRTEARYLRLIAKHDAFRRGILECGGLPPAS